MSLLTVVLDGLIEAGHLEMHPKEALELMDAVTPGHLLYPCAPLKQCLDRIESAAPSLREDPSFRR